MFESNIWIINFFINWAPEHWRIKSRSEIMIRGWYTVGDNIGTFRRFRVLLSRFLLELNISVTLAKMLVSFSSYTFPHKQVLLERKSFPIIHILGKL